MARGISSFTQYTTRRVPGFTVYGCPYCAFTFLRGRGNALAAAARAKAAIREHVNTRHADRAGDATVYSR